MKESQDPLVLSTKDACLHQSDLDTLANDEWVGDNVLAFHAEWLNSIDPSQIASSKHAKQPHQVKMFPPSVVELLCSLQDASQEDLKQMVPIPAESYLLLPVSDRYDETTSGRSSAGSHWSLVLFDTQTGGAFHFDSLGDINRTAAETVHRCVLRLFSDRVTARACLKAVSSLRSQTNSSDCGVYVLYLSSLLYLTLSAHEDNTASKMDDTIAQVCSQSSPQRASAFRSSYLAWLQEWGRRTHHEEHVDASNAVRSAFFELLSDFGVEKS